MRDNSRNSVKTLDIVNISTDMFFLRNSPGVDSYRMIVSNTFYTCNGYSFKILIFGKTDTYLLF